MDITQCQFILDMSLWIQTQLTATREQEGDIDDHLNMASCHIADALSRLRRYMNLTYTHISPDVFNKYTDSKMSHYWPIGIKKPEWLQEITPGDVALFNDDLLPDEDDNNEQELAIAEPFLDDNGNIIVNLPEVPGYTWHTVEFDGQYNPDTIAGDYVYVPIVNDTAAIM